LIAKALLGQERAEFIFDLPPCIQPSNIPTRWGGGTIHDPITGLIRPHRRPTRPYDRLGIKPSATIDEIFDAARTTLGILAMEFCVIEDEDLDFEDDGYRRQHQIERQRGSVIDCAGYVLSQRHRRLFGGIANGRTSARGAGGAL